MAKGRSKKAQAGTGDKLRRLVAAWRKQQAEAARLDAEMEKSFEMLGFGQGSES